MYRFMKVYISLTSVNKYWGMKKNNSKKFFGENKIFGKLVCTKTRKIFSKN